MYRYPLYRSTGIRFKNVILRLDLRPVHPRKNIDPSQKRHSPSQLSLASIGFYFAKCILVLLGSEFVFCALYAEQVYGTMGHFLIAIRRVARAISCLAGRI
jgi:hypothetical protein